MWIGVRGSYALAIAASTVAALGALAIDRRLAVSSPDPVPGPTRRAPRLALIAAAAGAIGLALEVLWTRLFAQVLHNSVYSFTAVAVVFLLALAAGAGIAGFLLGRRADPSRLAAAALVAAGVGTMAGFWLLMWWTGGLGYFGMHDGLVEYVLRIVALAGATAGPAALAAGAVLPALWAARDDRTSVARPLGVLAGANLLGGAAGALAAGFAIIPSTGVRGGMLLAAAAYVMLALSLLDRRWRGVAWAALFAIVVAHPFRASLVTPGPGTEHVRATLEGASGIVSVVERSDDLQIRLDNYYVLGGTAAATNERRMGLVPLLLHPDPRRAAFIGLATGITASAAPALGIERTTVAELVPEVAAAAREHFGAWNDRLLERRDVDLVLDDGRRYLAASRERFDVIVSDLFIPWHAGAGSLYSRDMYDTMARRLAPRGLFCQWLPLYQLTREDFAVIAHTFLEVFPDAQLWRADFYPDRPVLGLVGRLARHAVALDEAHERVRRLPAWAHDPLLAAPHGLAMLYAGDLHAAADLFADAPLNRDDRPVLEFLAPRLTRMTTAGDKDWLTGEALASLYDALAERAAAAPAAFASGREHDAVRAGTALYGYALAAARHESERSARLQSEVRALVPDVIVAADAEAAVADERARLARLRAEGEDMRRRIEVTERRLQQLDEAAR